MREIKLMGLFYIFWILLVNVSGQSDYDETSYYPTDGEDEIRKGLELSRDLIALAKEISYAPDPGFYSSGSSSQESKSSLLLNLLDKEKLKTSLWAKMNREQRLTDHANLKLHYMVNKEKVEIQNHYRRVAQLRTNDQLVARAWERSPTGKRDGRYWHQLSVGEKEVMKMRYVRHHNPEIFEEKYPHDLVIPESEYAMAWEISNFGNDGIPKWKQLRNFETKNKFRKSYYDHKLAKLTPKFDVSDDELAEAWEVAHLGGSGFVSWEDISDSKIREKFRESYLALLYRNEGRFSEPKAGQNKMVALANFQLGLN